MLTPKLYAYTAFLETTTVLEAGTWRFMNMFDFVVISFGFKQ